MKIGFVGLPYYSKKLKNELQKNSSEHSFYHFDTYYSKWDQFRFMLYIRQLDVVFSFNGALDKSKVFDTALKYNKRLIFNWSGTDVLKATKAYQSGNYNKDYYTKAEHICQAPWIQEELKQIGISAKTIHFQHYTSNPSKWKEFRVVTRIGENRTTFYGLERILSIAENCPKIPFDIVGMEGINQPKLPNVRYLGWVDNFSTKISEYPVLIRLPEHDGLSTIILEALSKGMHCLYNYDFPGITKINTIEEAIATIQNLFEQFNQGNFPINMEGIAYIDKEHDKEKIISQLISFLTQKI